MKRVLQVAFGLDRYTVKPTWNEVRYGFFRRLELRPYWWQRGPWGVVLPESRTRFQRLVYWVLSRP